MNSALVQAIQSIATSLGQYSRNPITFYGGGALTNSVSNTETAVGTITIPSLPYPVNVFLIGNCGMNMGSGAPTYNAFLSIRKTNAAGALLHRNLNDKTQANGVSQDLSFTVIASDSLAANTSQVYVLTTRLTVVASGAIDDGTFIAIAVPVS